MKILISCLLAASAVVCSAQRVTALPFGSEQTIRVCGKPLHDDRMKRDDGSDFTVRALTYPRVTLIFGENGAGDSVLVKAQKGTGGRDLKESEVMHLLPCLASAERRVTPVAPAPAPATTPQSTDTAGPWIFTILVVGVLLLMAIYQLGKNRAWSQRPLRLCLACLSVRQPLQLKNHGYYCPVCNADNPVPLDSPAAAEFRAKQAAPPPAE